MFNKLKTFFGNFGLFVKYGETIRAVATAWRSYPGLDDPTTLRTWVRPILVDISVLTTLTRTPIDDIIAGAAVRIVDNNSSWTVVHSMALFIRDSRAAVPSVSVSCCDYESKRNSVASRIRITEGNAGSLETITREALPDCPHLAIAAVGLLLYLLQRFNQR